MNVNDRKQNKKYTFDNALSREKQILKKGQYLLDTYCVMGLCMLFYWNLKKKTRRLICSHFIDVETKSQGDWVTYLPSKND